MEAADEPLTDEENFSSGKKWEKHATKVKLLVKKGAQKGKDVDHFVCKYCSKPFKGPSSTSLLEHVKSKHPKSCGDLLLPSSAPKLAQDFFKKSTMGPFDENVFIVLLLK